MRAYIPIEEQRATDPTWPGGAWGRGGGTLPLFVSREAAAWLLTASAENGEHQSALRMTSYDPCVYRPLLKRAHEFFGSREAAERPRKELLHTGLIAEAGYSGHYLTVAGEIIAARLQPPPYESVA